MRSHVRIANDLKLGILLAGLGWVGVYRGLIVLAVFIFLKVGQCFLGVGQWSSLSESLLYLLHILAH
jgi:hypothetical protein